MKIMIVYALVFRGNRFLEAFWNMKPAKVQAAVSSRWSKMNRPALAAVKVDPVALSTIKSMVGVAWADV